MASFTNWGKCVDIFAPGVNVESLSNLESNINNTRILSGTSMSSPVAAGVASVLFSKNVTFENMKDEILGLAHRDKIPLINFLLKPKSPNKILSTGLSSDDYHGPDIIDDIDNGKNRLNATKIVMHM
ncbi:unnamed protein product [[Candida] boidinii]|nr:unnamed protein product [[Candida] boidinii]